jgi:hypothetical protein
VLELGKSETEMKKGSRTAAGAFSRHSVARAERGKGRGDARGARREETEEGKIGHSDIGRRPF